MPRHASVTLLCGLPLVRNQTRSNGVQRQSSTLQVLLSGRSEKWTSDRLESLESCLADEFAISYLLRFSATEFNSENISFIIAARSYFAQTGPPSNTLKTCLASVCLPAELKVRAKEWLKKKESDEGDDEGDEIIREAYKLCHRTVEFDTFLRFKSSDFCAEFRALHLSNMLQRVNFRAFLSNAKLTEVQQMAVQFWVSANEFELHHTSLASGWAAELTVNAAKSTLSTFEETLHHVGLSEEALLVLKKRLPEAPFDLFYDAQLATLNFLSEPYERLLDSASCEKWLENAGLARLSVTTLPPSMADLEAEYGLDDEDYAAGW